MRYNWDYLDPKAYNNKVGNYKFSKELSFIRHAFKNEKGNLLDIAGGSGRFAIPLAEYFNEVTVVEKNHDAISLLTTRNSSIRTIEGDIMQVKIEDRFSLIICIEALDYFENWAEFFKKVNGLMKEDGMFIFTYTNPSSWRYYLRKIKHLWKKGYTYNKMDFEKFKVLLGDCSFNIVDIEGMNWIPFPLASNNIFVNFFIRTENLLHLNKWIGQSPWLLISVQKK